MKGSHFGMRRLMTELHRSLMTSLIRIVKLIIEAATAPEAICNRRVSSPVFHVATVSGRFAGDEQPRLVKERVVPAEELSDTHYLDPTSHSRLGHHGEGFSKLSGFSKGQN